MKLYCKDISVEVRKIVEYKEFFVDEEPIEIGAALRLFSRNTLVRMATILSLHYGNICWPDSESTLFSETSKKHLPYLNKLFNAYYERHSLTSGQKVEILTYRTSLELWRSIFAIRAEEFTNVIEVSDAELILFRVILSINEKILQFTEKDGHYELDELVFLNAFLTNDSNDYHLKAILQPQLHYFYHLIDYIPSNEVLTKSSNVLFEKWGINNWRQYYTTLLAIAHQTDKYIKAKANGVPIITHEWIQINRDFISSTLLECLCIDEEEYIPYEEEDIIIKEQNVDYRRFRAKPFVKLKDGSGYVVINNQLVCERLYNSLFFDFAPLINGREGSCGTFDYNKEFVEKVLFRKTFFSCLMPDWYTFPAKTVENSEKANEPDFYVRTKRSELIVVECKAIKMNGECRDDGDYKRLLDELHEKIVLKTRNIDKARKAHKGEPEPIGVGQLIRHIDCIEANTFEWDKKIPDQVSYYPLIVFEDIKLVQKGILSIINRWFYESVRKEKELSMADIDCSPIMVVSINTLFLYNKLIRKRGLVYLIDDFVEKYLSRNAKTGEYDIPAIADFDEYLRKNRYNKSAEINKRHQKLMGDRSL